MRARNLSFFVFLLLFFCSCSTGTIQEFRIDKNRTITVQQGSQFNVVMAEDHAAGQTWSLDYAFDGKVLGYIGSSYRGAKSGLTDFLFEAKEKGETVVKLKLVEYSVQKETAEITVKVE
jgi:hypothetical protein